MSKFNKLSRAEMKNVLGGLLPGGGYGQATCSYFGTCQGYTGAPTNTYDPDNTGLANSMQNDADKWCLAHACCTNADCAGATTPPA